jgi:hypothetical protein
MIIALLLANRPVSASCAENLSAEEKFQRSEIVFSGEVVGVGETFVSCLFGLDYPVTFKVEKD